MNRQPPVYFRYSVKIIYLFIIVVVAATTVGVIFLLKNVTQRKEEAKQHVFRVVEVTEDTIDPIVWGKNYPRQYDGYRRTVDTERTRHGGSDAFSKLEEDSHWREIFKGYAFGVDYREDRGHACTVIHLSCLLTVRQASKQVYQRMMPIGKNKL
jgi:nitrite reductase (cytochrome c-552)